MMAIYHLHMRSISRGKGSSAMASLAYITGRRYFDQRENHLTKQYARRERVKAVNTIYPEGFHAKSEEEAWNRIVGFEKNKNAQEAKMINVALPRELNFESQCELMERYVKDYFAGNGYIATYAIHIDDEGNNPHAHILVSSRDVNPLTGDFYPTKYRKEYALDAQGQRIPIIDPATGKQKVDKRNRKQWKRVNVEVSAIDQKQQLLIWRHAWAEYVNQYLRPLNVEPISEKSFKEQGIVDQKPTVHEGYAAREMEKRGQVSERCEMNREIKRENAVMKQLREKMEKLAAEIKQLSAEFIAQLQTASAKVRDLWAKSENLNTVERSTGYALQAKSLIHTAYEQGQLAAKSHLWKRSKASQAASEAFSKLKEMIPQAYLNEVWEVPSDADELGRWATHMENLTIDIERHQLKEESSQLSQAVEGAKTYAQKNGLIPAEEPVSQPEPLGKRGIRELIQQRLNASSQPSMPSSETVQQRYRSQHRR